jgi:hypothetical protein
VKGKEKSGLQEECRCHLEGGTLHMTHVKGICYEFIKIYDSRSYIEEVKGLRAQSRYFILERRSEQPRIRTYQ